VETLLTIVILGIISTFVGMFMFYDVNMYKHIKSGTQDVQESRMAVQRMSTELRQIASTDSISTANLTSIQFYDVEGTQILYQFSGGVLFRNGSQMLNSIKTFEFSYFDNSETKLSVPVSDPADIRYIMVELEKYVNDKTIDISTRVFPRNFR
jgi:hypothetical protein